MYASLYPSLLRQYNIAAHTQIGKIMIIDTAKVIEQARVYNKAHLEKWTPEIAFMEDIQSHNWLEFCYRWFNLASYQELYHEVEEIFESIICPVNGLRDFNREGLQYIFFDNANHPKYNNNTLQEVFIPNLPNEEKSIEYSDNLQEIFIENKKYEEIYVVPNLEAWNIWRQSRQVTKWNV